jgi:CDP-paratose 2-epimerase
MASENASGAKRILITGGAGFVGSGIAVRLKQAWPDARVVALDNLRRRGSELIVQRLREHGIEFLHGDVRVSADLPTGDFDLLVECSAEPSVLAGYGSSPDYLIDTNLNGLLNCLEWSRQHHAALVFLSTSRVYPVKALAELPLDESPERFDYSTAQKLPGIGPKGVSEDFPLAGHRSLYGATKLAAELLIEEYRHAYGLQAVVNRCGVLAGPWQMGKIDQGVFTFWLLRHHFKQPLSYIGFGGKGQQTRDLLHVDDLAELILEQATDIARWDGDILNVGGGRQISLSLQQTTALCQKITGNTLDVHSVPENRVMDIPVYYSDCTRLFAKTSWRPQRNAETILTDTYHWLLAHSDQLKAVL